MRAQRWIAALLAVAALAMVVFCGGLTAAYFLGNLGTSSDSMYSFGCGSGAHIADPEGNLPHIASFGDEQMHNAAVIIKVGQDMKVPPRGWVIAVATAMQESWLVNMTGGDRDSVGLFQQRPSQGWGSFEQVHDPAYAAGKFYDKLLQITGWESMALTDAAQRVQISAFPNAYAKHEPMATQIVNALSDGAARAAATDTTLRCTEMGEISASGWTAPLQGEIVSGFRTADRPKHDGTDIWVPKGTDIHAANAGVVTRVRCNAIGPDGSNWGCDRDGSPSVRGCGWYVDILHAGGVMTRYCHQVMPPLVRVGQQVAAGQVIGKSGSTGNSSGPHLHFEVHVNSDSSSRGAIDPVPFMVEKGAPLGTKQ